MGETGLRQRKKKSRIIHHGGAGDGKASSTKADNAFQETETSGGVSTIVTAVNTLVGLVVMVYISYHYAVYCNTLHENQMYFTNIKVRSWLVLA